MQKFLYQSFPQSSEVTYEMNSKIFQDSNSSSEKDPHPLTKQVTSGIINHCKIHSMTSQSRNSRNSGRTEKGEEEEAYSKALYTSYQKQRCVPALLKRKGWGGGWLSYWKKQWCLLNRKKTNLLHRAPYFSGKPTFCISLTAEGEQICHNKVCTLHPAY